jgi:hypothetical protein
MSVSSIGAALFKNSTDSSTAFQVQNANNTLFNVDTSNTVITLATQNSGATTTWASANSSGFSARANAATAYGNGYAYVIGGRTVTGGGSNTYFGTVQYSKMNADGTLGNWTTTTALGVNRFASAAVYANGYLYVIGGSTTNSISNVTNTVYYGKVNNDGTVSSWNTTSTLNTATFFGAATYHNGYIYYVGGINSGNVSVGTVQYAKVNADGTLGTGTWNTTTPTTTGTTNGGRDSHGLIIAGNTMYVFGGEQNGNVKSDVLYNSVNNDGTLGASWTDQGATNALPAANEGFAWSATDGYVYVYGGFVAGTQTNKYYYAPIPAAGGQLGAWTDATSTNPLTAARGDATGFTANGYIYNIAGTNTSTTSQTAIYYTSTGRVRISGALDLVGLTGQTLADGTSTGGTLTAGNTTIAGTLQVQGSANFSQSVGVSGNLSVGGDTLTVVGQIVGNAGTTIAGTISLNTTGSATTTIGSASAGAISLQSSGAINLTAGAASTISTSAGNLTVQGGSGTVSLGTSTNLTASGALTVAAGGSNQNLTLSSSGTGSVIVKPGTDNTTAFQVQNAAGTTSLFTVDSSTAKIKVSDSATLLSMNIDSTGLVYSTISRTNRTSAASATSFGTGPYTPAGTFTPGANKVLIAYVNYEPASGQVLPSDSSNITLSGGSLTWTPITGKTQQSGSSWGIGFRAFYAVTNSSPPSNMQVTADSGAFNIHKYEVTVDEMSGVDLVTPVAGAVAASRTSNASNTWTATLAATPVSADWEVTVGTLDQDNATHAWSAPAGWAEISTIAALRPSPDPTIQTQTGSTSTTINYALSGGVQYSPADTAYGGFILKAATTSTINVGAATAAINIGNSSSLTDFNGSVIFQNGTDSTTALQIQNAAGTSNLFIADTTNSRIGLGITPITTSGSGLLQVGGSGATTAAQGVSFGGDTSTNLYRSASGVLTTDGSMVIQGSGGITLGAPSSGAVPANGKIVFNNSSNTNTITLQTGATSSSYSLTLPTSGAASVGQCIQTSGTTTQLAFGACTATGLGKNVADTSSASISASNFLYTFTNSNSAVASGVLKLDNGTNTNSALQVTASGNPTSGQALIFASNTNASPSGNLLDLQSGSSPTSKFNVASSGSINSTSNSSTGFVIQDGTITSLSVDTSADLVQIGSSSTDANAIELVLDSYNNATDPGSPVNGTMYYNSATSKFRCYEGGAWKNCINGIAEQVETYRGTAATALTKGAAGTILLVPIYIPGQITINEMRIEVRTTVLGAAGDIGLYNSAGTLVLNGGSSSLTTATGLKTITPTQSAANRIIEPGQYYMAVTWNAATGSVSGTTLTTSGNIKRVGTLTGGGLVLPSSITPSSITTGTSMVYASFNN